MQPTPPRDWIQHALKIIDADFQRSADTHLIPLALEGYPSIDFYLKDESSHPTGSLKHRLARSLFLYSLVHGWLRPGAPVIEASSGSTAVSEAYFARLLGLEFIAVMPASTQKEKIDRIAFYGGQSRLIDDPTAIVEESRALAARTGGHFLDQFTFAERATDWRANNNIADSIFRQLARERHPIPAWIVSSPGTGGTLATLGRYVRYRQHPTAVLGADPERSVFFDAFVTGDRTLTSHNGSRIEGIGRPRVEASFLPEVLDAMVKVPDALSFGAMQWISERLGRKVGPSTGTNFIGVLAAAADMQARGQAGSVVFVLCDGGDRYAATAHDPAWLQAQGHDVPQARAAVEAAACHGEPLPGKAGQLAVR
jgi:cysteine synthase A